mgnify:FL=1
MMKKVVAILVLMAIASLTRGGNINLFVSGYVFEESTLEPVTNHLVTIKVKNEYPLILHFEKLYTNESGFFSCVMDLPVSSGIVTVSTIDCNNQFIIHTHTFNTLKTHITSNFVICASQQLSFCQSDFLYAPDIQFPYTFYFKETSLGDIESWLWDFGDGNFSNEQNPTHTFTVEGIYEVCLTVADSEGECLDEYCETLSIYEDDMCEALFTSFPFSGIDNTVQFWDLSSGEIALWNWDFGDGTTSNEQNVVHTYQASGFYEICLTVADQTGNCTSTWCSEVQVSPIADCNAGYTYFYNQNNALALQFLDMSQGSPDSWLWDFNDGTVSFEKDPVHVFPEEGIYDVSLTIFNQETGCQDNYYEMVLVSNQITCNSFFNHYPFPVDPATYQFVDLSTGVIEQYLWDFGDGQTSNYQNPVHSFFDSGIYNVCLTVSDASGNCINQFCETIFVGIVPECEADFYFLQDSLNPLIVHFSDISTGEADTWEWNFGDGTTSTLQNPSHTFPGQGVYMVTLSIEDAAGACSDQICREVVISGLQNCQAVFNYFIYPNNPFLVQFIDFSTGTIDVWLWDFGDGNFGFGTEPLHVYENEGIYTVCLYVMNTISGISDQYCKLVEISNNPDCFAEFTILPSTADLFTFQFADQSGGNIVEWNWDFGDGSISTLKNPLHTFAAEGIYEVCLTVKNMMGNCQETLCKTVMVDVPDLCNADFRYDNVPGQPLTLQFDDESTGILNQWYWDFGDGFNSNQQHPVHIYSDSGTYLVQLSVFHDDSIAFCNSTIQKQVPVYLAKPNCMAGFTAVPDSGINKPRLFHFHNTSTGNPDLWNWDFGDGTTSDIENPQHQYAEPGSYAVKLRITTLNPYGENCVDSITQQITMPDYYHIGGFVYGNGYPINNPVDNGDTAIVYVYRFQNENTIPLDTASFTDLGYFYFLNLLESNYLLKFRLSAGSTHFSDYFPTYYSNNLRWQESGLLHLSGTNFYDAHVSLAEIPQSDFGIGQITGDVVSYFEATGGLPFPSQNTEVLLFDANMQAVAYEFTSASGAFRFDNLSFGIYYLLAESAGMLTEPVAVALSNTHPVVDNVRLTMYSGGLTAINDPDENHADIQIYPNPADDYLYLSSNTLVNGLPQISISEITGKNIPLTSSQITRFDNALRINVSKLPQGVYVMKVITGNGLYFNSYKFIK